MKVTLIYIHGFNGAGSKKAKELVEYFSEHTVLTPEIPLSPDEALACLTTLIESIVKQGNPVYLVGSSLGGWYALYFSAIFQVPVFLINPSITPWISLVGDIPDEYLKKLEALRPDIESKLTYGLVNAFLANDDERINHTEFIKRYITIRTLKTFDDVGHRFTKFKELIIPEIERVFSEDSN